jgi:glycosyltransferase involved in cell wall biosynthesis
MSNIPKVSLGLPVYNGEKFLKSTLESIISQSFTDFRLIICDNYSTDRTEEICREFMEKDSRISYVKNEKNLGAAANFNKVFKLSEGKYFKWATYDDILMPNFLQKCVDVLESNDGTSLCYSKRIIIDEFGNEIDRVSDGLFLDQNETCYRYRHFVKRFRYTTKWAIPVLGLFRYSELAKTRLLGTYPAADTIILCEVALRGRFHEIDEYLFMSRKHDQMSNKANPTAAKLALFYDPKNKGKIQFPRWKWLYENKKSIELAPLKFTTKIGCYLSLGSWSFFRAKSLLVDLFRAIPQLFFLKFRSSN